MTPFAKIATVAALTVSALAQPVLAQDNAEGLSRQEASLQDNRLKAFAYDWYARFDNGPTIEALLPNLAEEGLEFVYPQATITSLDDLSTQFQAAWGNTKASAHDIEDIRVYAGPQPDSYMIVTPHRYFIAREDGTFGAFDIVSRMIVQDGVVTAADPEGEAFKIQNYRVIFEGMEDRDVTQDIAALRSGDFSVSDAKSFVHQWFAATDARDVEALIDRTSTGPLGINLLGTQITDREGLRTYLEANSGAQTWATHTPHNIVVRPTEDGFDVRFIVHFEGNVEGMGDVALTNVTNWHLIDEDGALRLRDYTLDLF